MSIKLGLVLEPEIQRCLDTRCVGLSTERPTLFAAEGLIRYETDTQRFVYYTHGPGWIPLFNAIQTDPYVLGLVETVGQDLSEIHRRLNDGFPDVYQRLQHIEDNLTEIHQRIDYIDARGRQMKASVEELETMIINNEQRNEQLHQRIESFIGRLNAVEGDAPNDNDNGDNTNDDPPPLALF